MLGVRSSVPVMAQDQNYWDQQRSACLDYQEEVRQRESLPADQLLNLPPLSSTMRKNCLYMFGFSNHPPSIPSTTSNSLQAMPKPVAAPTPALPSGTWDYSNSIQSTAPPGSATFQQSGPLLSPLHGFSSFSKTPLHDEPDASIGRKGRS